MDPGRGGRRPGLRTESILESDPDLSFADVGGMEELLETLTERVVQPLRNPRKYDHYGIGTVGGVLLYGPPGCGKTHVARALAGETDYDFVEVTPADVTSKYVGQAADNVEKVFEVARENRPALLFLDEVDAIASDRSGLDNATEQQMVNQLLAELDDVPDGVVVIAATNYLADVDDAILRSGRFDERIEVPPPDRAARRAVLTLHLRDPPTESDLSVDAAARETAGYATSDVELVAELAARFALEETEPVADRHLKRAIEETESSLHGWLDRYDWLVERGGSVVERSDAGDPGDTDEERGHRSLESFEDLAGMTETKRALHERVLEPFVRAERYESRGIDPVDGALLTGPPGCGKTSLAHAMAGELDVPLFEVSPESLFGADAGDPVETLEDDVSAARNHQPAVLCLADLDELAPAADATPVSTRKRVPHRLSALLSELSGARCLVVGTARDADAIAGSLLGPFDEHVQVPRPDDETRLAVLRREVPEDLIPPDPDWSDAVAATRGFATSAVRHVAHAAARRAIRNQRPVTAALLVEVAETTPGLRGSGSRDGSDDNE